MATIGRWSLKAYHSVGLNATAPFGGRGDVYGVDLGDPIESDGVLDLALDFAWTMELPKPGRCNLGPLHECVDPLVAITTHGVVVGDRLDRRSCAGDSFAESIAQRSPVLEQRWHPQQESSMPGDSR